MHAIDGHALDHRVSILFGDYFYRLSNAEIGIGFRSEFSRLAVINYPEFHARNGIYRISSLLSSGGFGVINWQIIELDYLIRNLENLNRSSVKNLSEPLLIKNQVESISYRNSARSYIESIVPLGAREHPLGVFQFPIKPSGQGMVSIIVWGASSLEDLAKLVEALLGNSLYPNCEIILALASSGNSDVTSFGHEINSLDDRRVRAVMVEAPVNELHLLIEAALIASGEFLLFLHGDAIVVKPDWLPTLLAVMELDWVGMSGPCVLNFDKVIVSSPLLVGVSDHSRGLHDGQIYSDTYLGYMNNASYPANVSRLSARYFIVKRPLLQQAMMRGLDTGGVNTFVADLCLAVRDLGFDVIWNPWSVLAVDKQCDALPEADVNRLVFEKWPSYFGDDPTYPRNFSIVEPSTFLVETNLLLCNDPAKGVVEHRVVAFAADPHGCGHYRMLQPMQAMLEAGLCTGGASPELFGPNLALRSGADTLVFQRPYTDANLSLLESLLPLKNVLKVYEVDDDLSRVPMKNSHRDRIPKDIRARMMRNIGVCDRLVVSTEYLAHQFRGANDDIRVVQNRLPKAMWGQTPPTFVDKGERRKPVVGWAGGISHQGDLELIAQVVKETADQVDWVFFGMCPEAIRPYVRAFHPGVPTVEYPKRLMEITRDWDLAVAPLELNAFNEAKSNLRLLEYGWCGLPVVCTDITPYQCDLPSIRIKNRFKDWRNTILDAVHDLPATRRLGQSLQESVVSEWMLEGRHLEAWYRAWTDR